MKSKIRPIFHGEVKDQKLILKNKEKFLQYLRGLEGKEVTISLGLRKRTRSINQNKYYWGVVLEIFGNALGIDVDDLHEVLISKFLGERVIELVNKDGVKENYSVSQQRTKALETDEFEDYLEKVRRWAVSNFNIYIPLPNEFDYEGDINIDE